MKKEYKVLFLFGAVIAIIIIVVILFKSHILREHHGGGGGGGHGGGGHSGHYGGGGFNRGYSGGGGGSWPAYYGLYPDWFYSPTYYVNSPYYIQYGNGCNLNCLDNYKMCVDQTGDKTKCLATLDSCLNACQPQ